jgi:type II secretory pathway component PulK
MFTGATSGVFTGQQGGVGARIIMIVATLAVVAAAIFWFLDSRQKNQEILNRKAVEISELGLLQALARLKENPSWTGTLPKTDCEGGWYTAKAVSSKSADATFLKVEVLGHIGSVVRKQECVLRLTVTGNDSLWVRQVVK